MSVASSRSSRVFWCDTVRVQVEGVTDAERDRAWKRIRSAAEKYDVEVSAKSWRELFSGDKAKKR